MNNTTNQTRIESYERINKTIRQEQVKEILSTMGKATAKEIAIEMYKKGYTYNAERNNSSPRLTELEHLGIVRVIDKTKCEYTGKTVAVYSMVN